MPGAIMREAFNRVVQGNRIALTEGVKITRNVLEKHPPAIGYTTREFYELVLKQRPPENYPLPSPVAPPTPTPKAKAKFKYPMPTPPHPEHPARSMAFFKHSILPFLEGTKEIEKFHTTKIITSASVEPTKGKKKKGARYKTDSEGNTIESIWLWKAIDLADRPKPPVPKAPEKAYGEEVGVGEDLDHLNKRRERARHEKIRADVQAMKVIDGMSRRRGAAGFGLRTEKQPDKPEQPYQAIAPLFRRHRTSARDDDPLDRRF